VKKILKKEVERLLITESSSLTDALKQMDKVGKKLLIVKDQDGKYKSILSIGDIQRHLIENQNFEAIISNVLRPSVRIANKTQRLEEIKKEMLEFRMEFMPVVDNEELLGVYFWEDVFGEVQRKNDTYLNLPVVIMAGGKGTRLQPLTNVIPKPLIPIGHKTILEEIMDRFVDVGCHEFYLSVNYRASTIKHYLSELNNEAYQVSYFQESKPLGTAGSMYLLKDKLNSTFFVSNCDIIIDQDLEDIYEYHRRSKNDITVVSALKHNIIPYGTIETGKNGVLKKLSEKPQVTYQINTGVYILEPNVLNSIPEDEFFHITDLIEKIKRNNGKIGVFPISEGAWQDIGEWVEYKKVLANNGFII
jgi:dTDP-glucose pyrophosphorylase